MVFGFYRSTVWVPLETSEDADQESVEMSPLSNNSNDELFRYENSDALRTKNTSKPSLFLALCKTYITIFLTAGFLKLINDLLNFVGPQILKLDLTSSNAMIIL